MYNYIQHKIKQQYQLIKRNLKKKQCLIDILDND